MRSPAIVFSLFAVSALSPSLVYGSPVPNGLSQHVNPGASDHHRTSSGVAARGLGFLGEVFARSESTPTVRTAPTSKPKVASIANIPVGKREFWKRATTKNSAHDLQLASVADISGTKQEVSHRKRLDDSQTTGGNAHTGKAGAVDGGSVDSGDNGGMPTLMNINSNNAGTGGGSTTGCAASGKGATGGNASSGDSGTATGGDVRGTGGMMNVDSNNAGSAGESSTGCATGGNSADAGNADGGAADTTDPAAFTPQ
ncbi:hypothetical protein EIP86_000831 [Pleurotus ostreatoroseus]|nr:hypothetical protein EIP86_000831 [Pleurotus ostreatoroseus]